MAPARSILMAAAASALIGSVAASFKAAHVPESRPSADSRTRRVPVSVSGARATSLRAATQRRDSAQQTAPGNFQWVSQQTPFTGGGAECVLIDVHVRASTEAPGAVVGYVAGEGGVILKTTQSMNATTNGTWASVSALSFPYYFYGAYAFSDSDAMVSGFTDGSAGANGIVSYTSDGGQSWSTPAEIDPVNWAGGPIQFASDGMHGVMLGATGGQQWATSTGGRNISSWVPVQPDTCCWQ
jgi:hypothetical protein